MLGKKTTVRDSDRRFSGFIAAIKNTEAIPLPLYIFLDAYYLYIYGHWEQCTHAEYKDMYKCELYTLNVCSDKMQRKFSW